MIMPGSGAAFSGGISQFAIAGTSLSPPPASDQNIRLVPRHLPAHQPIIPRALPKGSRSLDLPQQRPLRILDGESASITDLTPIRPPDTEHPKKEVFEEAVHAF